MNFARTIRRSAKSLLFAVLALALLNRLPLRAHDSPEHEIEVLTSRMSKAGKTGSLLMRRATEFKALGELDKAAEIENSVYNLEVADVDLLFTLFPLFEKESQRIVEKGLVYPAYDYVLKCSHVFNILDARGAISATERAGYVDRVRDLSRCCAQLYVQQREEAGFPLLPKAA